MGLMDRIRRWWTGADDAPVDCCRRGHPFNEANTYERPDGRGRECRACRQIRRLEKSNQPDTGHNI